MSRPEHWPPYRQPLRVYLPHPGGTPRGTPPTPALSSMIPQAGPTTGMLRAGAADAG